LYGSEKKYAEGPALKRLAYALLGEVHVPARLRAYHVLRRIRSLGLEEQDGLRMIDAGSGRGDFAVHVARKFKNWSVLGMELDRERLDTALTIRERIGLKNLEFQSGDLLDPALKSEADLITCCDVLEHIEDDDAAMRSLQRCLREDGWLILTFPAVPQRPHLKLVEWREKRLGITWTDIGHVRQGYEAEEIRARLEGMGFRSVECRSTFGFWGTLCFDVFFVLGDSRPNPAVYLLAFPWLMLMAWLDAWFPGRRGSGLLVTAQK
jgi:2-polyprenyl-3-methyl-5-hydroxy-6-metoxy-1,4-benzoquinol methylase